MRNLDNLEALKLGAAPSGADSQCFCKFKIGDRVLVAARGDFYAFIDGWRGIVVGYEAGCVAIRIDQEEGGKMIPKRFLVPAAELEHTV